MKVCWFENADIVGGAELFSVDMLRSFPSDHQIEVVLGGENTAVHQLFANIPSVSIHHIAMPSLKPLSFSNVFSFLQSVWRVHRYLRIQKPDIVYANTVRTALVIRFAQWFLPKTPKTFYFAHDYTFPQKGASFLLLGFSKIFACSYSVKHFLSRWVDASQVEVIENGVDLSLYSAVPPVLHPARRVGIIGRICPWKGQLTLLHAAYILKESHHELPFRFFIIGEPSSKPEDQEYIQHLHHFVENNDLQSVVSFVGFRPMPDALHGIDIVVHAPTEPEPFGRVPLEAAAAGRLLCISQIGTPAQIFEHQKTALFFSPDDPLELANALREWYSNAPFGEECIENARAMVCDQFALPHIQQKFWNIFFQ